MKMEKQNQPIILSKLLIAMIPMINDKIGFMVTQYI